MADVIPLLPLPGPLPGRAAYYVPCPHCDKSGRRSEKHLNINLSKDVFRCVRCGWYGGIFDLYAHYTGTPREMVRDELIARRHDDDGGLGGAGRREDKAFEPPPPESIESPIADIQIRHETYTALMSMLTLASDHRRNLLERGLSENVMAENGYKTTPVVGGKMIAKRLIESHLCLEGVPGFYKDMAGSWTFANNRRGILIPVRDVRGRIQGLQIRRDDAIRRKFRWVSSSDIQGGVSGCGARGWVHLAGPVRERVLLTEGPLKADIVRHLTGETVLAVPGVHSLKYLEPALVELQEAGVTQVMTAFDMDFLRNPNVQKGYSELVNLLGRLNLRFGTYLWHPVYNGLDDYVWKHCLESVSDSIS